MVTIEKAGKVIHVANCDKSRFYLLAGININELRLFDLAVIFVGSDFKVFNISLLDRNDNEELTWKGKPLEVSDARDQFNKMASNSQGSKLMKQVYILNIKYIILRKCAS